MFNRRRLRGAGLRVSSGAAAPKTLRAAPRQAAVASAPALSIDSKQAKLESELIITIKTMVNQFFINVAMLNDNNDWAQVKIRYVLINIIINLGEKISQFMSHSKSYEESKAWHTLRNSGKHFWATLSNDELFEFIDQLKPIIYHTVTYPKYRILNEEGIKDLDSLVGQKPSSKFKSLSEFLEHRPLKSANKKDGLGIKEELTYLEFYNFVLRRIIPLINSFSKPFLQETNSAADEVLYDSNDRTSICEIIKECGVYYKPEHFEILQDFNNDANPLKMENEKYRADFIAFVIKIKTISNEIGHRTPKAVKENEAPITIDEKEFKEICGLARAINPHQFKTPHDSSLLQARASAKKPDPDNKHGADERQRLSSAAPAATASAAQPKPTIKYSIADLKAAAATIKHPDILEEKEVKKIKSAADLIRDITYVVGSHQGFVSSQELIDNQTPTAKKYRAIELRVRITRSILSYRKDDDKTYVPACINNFFVVLDELKKILRKIEKISATSENHLQEHLKNIDDLVEKLKLLKEEILENGFELAWLMDAITLKGIINPCLIVYPGEKDVLYDSEGLNNWFGKKLVTTHPTFIDRAIYKSNIIVIEDPNLMIKSILGSFVLYIEDLESNWQNHRAAILNDFRQLKTDEKSKMPEPKLGSGSGVDDSKDKPKADEKNSELFSEKTVSNLLQKFDKKSAVYLHKFKEKFNENKNNNLKLWCETELNSLKTQKLERNFGRIIKNILEQALLCCEKQPLDLKKVDDQIEMVGKKIAALIAQHSATTRVPEAKQVASNDEKTLPRGVEDNTEQSKAEAVEKSPKTKLPVKKQALLPLFSQDEIRKKLASLTSIQRGDLKSNLDGFLRFIDENPKPSQKALKSWRNNHLNKSLPSNYIEVITNLFDQWSIHAGTEEAIKIKNNARFIKELFKEFLALDLDFDRKKAKEKFNQDYDKVLALQIKRSEGKQIDILNNNKKSPLYIAIEGGHYPEARLIIDQGADVFLGCCSDKKEQQKTPLALLEQHAAQGKIEAKALLEYCRSKVLQETTASATTTPNAKAPDSKAIATILKDLENPEFDDDHSKSSEHDSKSTTTAPTQASEEPIPPLFSFEEIKRLLNSLSYEQSKVLLGEVKVFFNYMTENLNFDAEKLRFWYKRSKYLDSSTKLTGQYKVLVNLTGQWFEYALGSDKEQREKIINVATFIFVMLMERIHPERVKQSRRLVENSKSDAKTNTKPVVAADLTATVAATTELSVGSEVKIEQKELLEENARLMEAFVKTAKYNEAFAIILQLAKMNLKNDNAFNFFVKNEIVKNINGLLSNKNTKLAEEFKRRFDLLHPFRKRFDYINITPFYFQLEAEDYFDANLKLQALIKDTAADKELLNAILDEDFGPQKPTIRKFLEQKYNDGEKNAGFLHILKAFQEQGISFNLNDKSNPQQSPTQTVLAKDPKVDAKQPPIPTGSVVSGRELRKAAANKDIKKEEFENIIDRNISLIDNKGKDSKKSALYFAIAYGFYANARVLIDKGADMRLGCCSDDPATQKSPAKLLFELQNKNVEAQALLTYWKVNFIGKVEAFKNCCAAMHFFAMDFLQSLDEARVTLESLKTFRGVSAVERLFNCSIEKLISVSEQFITMPNTETTKAFQTQFNNVLSSLHGYTDKNHLFSPRSAPPIISETAPEKGSIPPVLVAANGTAAVKPPSNIPLSTAKAESTSTIAPAPASSATRKLTNVDVEKLPVSTQQSFFPPASSATAPAIGDQKQVGATDSKATAAALVPYLAIPDDKVKSEGIAASMSHLSKLALVCMETKEYKQVIPILLQLAKMNFDQNNGFNMFLQSDSGIKTKKLLHDNGHELEIKELVNNFNQLYAVRNKDKDDGATGFYFNLEKRFFSVAHALLHRLVSNKIVDQKLFEAILDENFGPNKPTVRQLLVQLRDGGEKHLSFIRILEIFKQQGIDLGLNTKTASSSPVPKP